MLGADLWSKRIENLGETGITEPKVTTEAQIRQGDEDEARRILDETQTPAFRTMNAEVEEIEFDDAEVQHSENEPPTVKPTEAPHHVDTLPVEPFQKEPDTVPLVPTKVNNPDDEPMTRGEMKRLWQEQYVRVQLSQLPRDAGNVEAPPIGAKRGADWVSRMPRPEDVPSPVTMTARLP
jgi:hypothetical protein